MVIQTLSDRLKNLFRDVQHLVFINLDRFFLFVSFLFLLFTVFLQLSLHIHFGINVFFILVVYSVNFIVCASQPTLLVLCWWFPWWFQLDLRIIIVVVFYLVVFFLFRIFGNNGLFSCIYFKFMLFFCFRAPAITRGITLFSDFVRRSAAWTLLGLRSVQIRWLSIFQVLSIRLLLWLWLSDRRRLLFNKVHIVGVLCTLPGYTWLTALLWASRFQFGRLWKGWVVVCAFLLNHYTRRICLQLQCNYLLV